MFVVIMIFCLFIVWYIHFVEKWNYQDLLDKRDALLKEIQQNANRGLFNSSIIVAELRDTDLKLIGGCKRKNVYIKCNLCDIEECPKHPSYNDYYYNMVENRPKAPKIW